MTTLRSETFTETNFRGCVNTKIFAGTNFCGRGQLSFVSFFLYPGKYNFGKKLQGLFRVLLMLNISWEKLGRIEIETLGQNPVVTVSPARPQPVLVVWPSDTPNQW